jgi:hypothetical protein
LLAEGDCSRAAHVAQQLEGAAHGELVPVVDAEMRGWLCTRLATGLHLVLSRLPGVGLAGCPG